MRDFAACFLAIQDEFCLEESIVRLRADGLKHALILSPDHYWTTSEPQDESDWEALKGIASRTGSELVRASFKAATPIQAEAHYRNHGAGLLWKQGFNHVLFVDADELWMPGALQELDALVADKDQSYQLPFVPSIGVPGYPVETISYGLVYIPKSATISWGRGTPTPHGQGTGKVLHFSATRRSLHEVVLKSRRSAHYPEPAYAFERWFQDVLPNVRPGSVNVHMYTGSRNIWPFVRNWSEEEWLAIPGSLHPYLGR